ncbi:hypothetical protein RD792_005395 [Penstemon davidsonii]|uniref:SWIM-type domain-containing protein n=1 Tax=Penstemon davidsonii TaxID=160366 RepID=A0ABR0DL98_9LAMI|nr:hypothetical protein RD792_005395 [Penstemon davidsonii]
MESKWIKHYSSDHRILLVGEGDFSFALSLATTFGDASNIVATSLDPKAELAIRHPTAAANLVALKEMGCTIIHELDVRNMSEHPLLRLFDFSKLDSRKLPLVTNNKLFNRIVFNFPHAVSDFKELEENQTHSKADDNVELKFDETEYEDEAIIEPILHSTFLSPYEAEIFYIEYVRSEGVDVRKDYERPLNTEPTLSDRGAAYGFKLTQFLKHYLACLAKLRGEDNGRRRFVEIDWDIGKFECDCLMLESDWLPCRHLFAATVYIGCGLLYNFFNTFPFEDPKARGLRPSFTKNVWSFALNFLSQNLPVIIW